MKGYAITGAACEQGFEDLSGNEDRFVWRWLCDKATVAHQAEVKLIMMRPLVFIPFQNTTNTAAGQIIWYTECVIEEVLTVRGERAGTSALPTLWA